MTSVPTHIFWKTDFFAIVNNNNKIAFDININVTFGVLVLLFLAKSLGVYKYTTPPKGTGACYLRWMWAWIWSPHSPDSCFFTRYLGPTLDSSVLFLFSPRPEKREKASDVSSDLAPELNAMSSCLPKSRRRFLGRWRDDLIWSGFGLTWMQNVRKDIRTRQLFKVVPSSKQDILSLIWTQGFMSYGSME